ncbi:MAG: HNH endonuclease [Acidobacteriales bacterium]|nr:HNH endonuclease [Terriglobales bacterium]
MRRQSAKARLREFFLQNIGIIVTSTQLRDAAGGEVSEWARRVRELREDEHWPIITHNDSADLKPGQYVLTELPPERFVTTSRTISAKLRAEVLDRNGFTCQMCGVTPGDLDPDTRRKVRLHIGHIKDKSLGGKEELSNLRALCSSCNQGAKNITAEKPTALWLLSQIRRAGISEQQAVLEWLQKKFGGG